MTAHVVHQRLHTLTKAITSLGDRSRWEAALELLVRVGARQVRINEFLWGAAMRACERGHRWPVALRVFRDLQHGRLQPNIVVYNAAIHASGQLRQWEQALHMLDSISLQSLQPNPRTHNEALGAIARAWHWAASLRLLGELWPGRCSPDVVSYSTCVSACEKAREWMQALELLGKMRRKGVSPNVVTFSALISCCEKGGEWKVAFGLFEQLRKERLKPDLITCNALLSSCEKGQVAQPALDLLDTMTRSLRLFDVVSYNASISACEKAALWTRSLGLLSELCRQALRPDNVSINAAMSACEKAGQWDHAVALLPVMRRRRLSPNAISLNVLVMACMDASQQERLGKQLRPMFTKERAWQLLSSMGASALHPDGPTLSRLLAESEQSSALGRELTLLRRVPSIVGAQRQRDLLAGVASAAAFARAVVVDGAEAAVGAMPPDVLSATCLEENWRMSRRVTESEWSLMVDTCSDKLRKLHGLREGSLHHTRENHAMGARCVLVDAGRRNEVVFMSRSLEDFTGMSASSVVGKSNLDFLCSTTHWLDDLFNGAGRRQLCDFCHSCARRTSQPANGEGGELLSLMVCCKAKGDPFWSLVHTLPMDGPSRAAQYILHILVPLEAAVPATIWITEPGEARLAAKANTEGVRPFLEEAQENIRARRVGLPVGSMAPVAERQVRAFSELMADAFLGTRFVPRLGRAPVAEFERLGYRDKVFVALESALRTAWGASDEACRSAAGSVQTGGAALACAVSDPCAQDCPLVYISSGFESLTGFRASWALGRNCRFLQPQQAGHAPVAINRGEVDRLRGFCKAGSGSVIAMLLNEAADGHFFWNLLFMQHLFLDSAGHGISPHYIFAMQTEVTTPDLSQLILRSWDSGVGPYRLQRLREILHSAGEKFNPREKSLFALCDEVFGKWAREVSVDATPFWSPRAEALAVGISSAPMDDFAQKWPACFDAAQDTLRHIFRMGETDLEAMRADMPGGVVFCLSDLGGEDCPLVFVSRGFEEMTGFTSDYAVGKNCRFLQPPLQEVNSTVNSQEIARLRAFCNMIGDCPRGGIVGLLLNERKSGERFWNLLHMHHLSVEGKRYILGVQSILPVPMPSMLRVARNLTPVEEAQHWHFLSQLGEHISKVRPMVDQQGLADMQSAARAATEHLRTFFETACPDYEGDHWVPCTGLQEANMFQKDMLWKRAFDEMKGSLMKIWEVSEGCEEDVAIAIADPAGKDCPLVYVSPKFETITGYSRDWAIGRNCRFLQPNMSWCNTVFNREETRAMRSFCEDVLPRGTRIVNLLVNEHKSRYPFINLLMMEHIDIPLPKAGSEPGSLYARQVYKPLVFGVQTALDGQSFGLVELLGMDHEALKQLDRLRQILRRRESTLRFQSLNTFARECIAEWMPGLPGYFSLPRLRLGAMSSWRRASVPALGLEITAQNMLEAVPQALEEGVRHFYLTFSPADREVTDESECNLQCRLLGLRLTELLNLMVPGLYHYLRSNISFTLVTPPRLMRAYEEVARALYLHSYALDSWLLDLRERPDRWDIRYVDYWRLMSGVRVAGGVGNIGVLGASRGVCERINTEASVPIGILGAELYPQKHWPDLTEKTYFEQQVSRGVLIVAFGVFGPRQALLESDAVAHEAERLDADPATLLMKWVEGQGYAMMLPRLRLRRSRHARLARGASAESQGSVSPSAGGRGPNFHRSFAKEYSKLLPGAVDDFFRRCHSLQGGADSPSARGGAWPQAPSSPVPEGGPSPRRRVAFGAPAVTLRSIDDGSLLSRRRPQSAKSGGSALSGGFDAEGVRSSMKLHRAAMDACPPSSRAGDGLQSLATEFSLALPPERPRPPVEREANQFVRKVSGTTDRFGRLAGA